MNEHLNMRNIVQYGHPMSSVEVPLAVCDYLLRVATYFTRNGLGCGCEYDSLRNMPHGIYVLRIKGNNREFYLCKQCKVPFDAELRIVQRDEQYAMIAKSLTEIAMSLKYIVAAVDKNELSTMVFSKEESKSNEPLSLDK